MGFEVIECDAGRVHKDSNDYIISLAKKTRKNQTEAEEILWEQIIYVAIKTLH